ncbi:MAG: phosphatidate cytidylyltransferase [Cyanobacteria bacterium P01_F01_bin.42]
MNTVLIQDLIATGVTLIGAIAWLRLWDAIAAKRWISSTLSRKIIHITTGPLFVLCWPLFSPSPWARVGAALVPLLISIQFLAVGLGWLHDPDAVQALTRTGDRSEILKGPLLYGLIFVVCTLVFWRTSPVGILGLMVVCGGDGFADIVGRRFGTVKLPWNRDKSWAGSAAMFAGAWLIAAVMLLGFSALGFFSVLPTPPLNWLWLTLIVLTATIIESFPIRDWDNLTIAMTSIGLGLVLLS